MKKFTGWLIIIVCSVSLLLVVFSVVAVIMSDRWQETTSNVISYIVCFVICAILLLVGLRNGLKKIKKDKIEKIIEYTDTLDINLTGRISYADYQKLMLGLNFKKPVYLVYVCLIILFSLVIIDNNSGANQISPIIFLFLLILGLFLFPTLMLIHIKKLYRTNRIFQEQLNYKLTNDSIHIKGETVDSIQKWTRFYKVKETKVFFMFYQGEGIATLLDKKMFTDNELTHFKRFICSLNFNQSRT